jgi:hypothetical protein
MPNDVLIAETQFKCPRCGGLEFGTSLDMGALDDPQSGTGHCHGMIGDYPNPRMCGFTWPRRDDVKYFKLTGRKLARTHIGTVST